MDMEEKQRIIKEGLVGWCYEHQCWEEFCPPRTYSLAEVRNGTGWPRDVRFTVVENDKEASEES